MPTVDQFINKAAGEIGNDGTKYNMWYWGYIQPAWCATFDSWVGDQIGLGGYKSAAVSGIYAALPHVATRSLSGVQRGDFACFNWDNRSDTGWIDHIGVVEWVNPATGEFGTIEGNTTNELCLRRTRSINAGYFVAFVRPPYDDVVSPEVDNPAPSPGQPSDTGSGIVYQVHTHKHGWLSSVSKVDDSVDGYAGWENSPIDAIKAFRADGSPLVVQVHTIKAGWLEPTTFTDSLWGANSSNDGYAGNITGSDAIDAIKINSGSIRVASAGGGYWGWLTNGVTPEGDDFAGDFGKSITRIQMKA